MIALADPHVSYSVAANSWRLEQAYFFEVEDFGFVVPAGFLFDLSSVPRLAWWLIAPHELSIAASVVHDYLYQHGGVPEWVRSPGLRQVTRARTDAFFYEIMQLEHVPGWRRQPAHAAVRGLGWLAWKDAPAP